MVTTDSRPIISDRHTGAFLEQCVANTLVIRFRWLSTTYRHLNIFTLLGTALTLIILVPTYFALFHSFLTLVLDGWSCIWFACSPRTFLDDFLRLLRLLMSANFNLIFRSLTCVSLFTVCDLPRWLLELTRPGRFMIGRTVVVNSTVETVLSTFFSSFLPNHLEMQASTASNSKKWALI